MSKLTEKRQSLRPFGGANRTFMPRLLGWLGRRKLTGPAELPQHCVQQERQLMLARDLHDTIAQDFTVVLMQLRVIATATLDPKTADHVRRAQDSASQGLEHVRECLRRLRATSTPHVGMRVELVGYLHAELLRTLDGSGLPLDFSGLSELHADSGATHELSMLAREIAHNTRKHAQASRVSCRLTKHRALLTLVIEDDGKGFDPQVSSGGYGLIGLHERAKELNGTLTIASKPGSGTRVTLAAPLSSFAPAMPPNSMGSGESAR